MSRLTPQKDKLACLVICSSLHHLGVCTARLVCQPDLTKGMEGERTGRNGCQPCLQFSLRSGTEYQTSLLVSEWDVVTQDGDYKNPHVTVATQTTLSKSPHLLSMSGEGDSSSNPTYGTIYVPAHVNKPLSSHSSVAANFPLLDPIAPGCGPLQRTFLPSGISVSKQDLWWSFGKDLWITGFHSIAKRVFQENLPLTRNIALQIYLFWWNGHSRILPWYCPWTRCYWKASETTWHEWNSSVPNSCVTPRQPLNLSEQAVLSIKWKWLGLLHRAITKVKLWQWDHS